MSHRRHATFPGQARVLGRPSSFTPASLDDLLLWLDASAITGLADADLMSTWSDQSGNGNDATQAGAIRPTYETNELNGRPGVRFTEASFQYFNVNGLAASLTGTDVPYSVIAVIRKASTNTIDTILCGSKSDATNPLLWTLTTAANAFATQHRDDAGTNKLPSGGTVGTDALVASYICSGTTVNIWKNGVQVVTNGDANVGALTINQVGIGAIQSRGAGATNYYDGFMFEIVVVHRAVSTAERQSLERHLGSKWGISVS